MKTYMKRIEQLQNTVFDNVCQSNLLHNVATPVAKSASTERQRFLALQDG